MGAMSTNRAFEMETLSQHRFLISKLQYESDAQRSQIETNHLEIETLQQRLDQLDESQPPISNSDDQQGYSRNVQSNSISQVPDLNEPLPEFRANMQQTKVEKGN
jgi:hypothetical protein